MADFTTIVPSIVRRRVALYRRVSAEEETLQSWHCREDERKIDAHDIASQPLCRTPTAYQREQMANLSETKGRDIQELSKNN